jgi:hypothetical protein
LQNSKLILKHVALKSGAALVFCIASLSVFAQVSEPLDLQTNESQSPSLGEQVGRIVWFSPPSDGSGQAVRITVNGAYHGALIPGTYTELCGPARTVKVVVGTGQREEVLVDMVAGQTIYIRLTQSANQKPQWQNSAVQQAVQEAAQAMPSLARTRVTQAQSCKSA